MRIFLILLLFLNVIGLLTVFILCRRYQAKVQLGREGALLTKRTDLSDLTDLMSKYKIQSKIISENQKKIFN